MKVNLGQFLAAKRYPFEQFLESVSDGRQQFELMRELTGYKALRFTSKQLEKSRFQKALAVGAYLSELGDASDQDFQRLADEMSSEDWTFSIRFHPFHYIREGLDALTLIGSAFKNSLVDLHHVSARMAAISTFDGFDSAEYKTESTKAAGLILSACSLHSAFIDSARRIADEVFPRSLPFHRARTKVISQSAKQHAFLRDLRNCYLHYTIQIPNMTKQLGQGREEYEFFLDGRDLLSLGFSWKALAKEYILRNV